MDYRKLDPALVRALAAGKAEKERTYAVFVQTERPPDAAQSAHLARLGVSGIGGARRVFTATLSAQALDELSEQPWVRYIQLSTKLRLLTGEEQGKGER